MRSILALPNDYTVVDIETTGLSPKASEIIEITAIRYREGIEVARFSQLVAIDHPIPAFITDLTGITDEMLEGKPYIHEVICNFCDFIGEDILVGHNIAAFDSNFIAEAYAVHLNKEFVNPCVDTMRVHKKLYPHRCPRTLEHLAWQFGVPYENAHRSAVDCEITNTCYQRMRQAILAEHSEEEFLKLCDKRAPKRKISEILPTGTVNPENPLYEKHIVFTGALSMTRQEAMQFAANEGAFLQTSVTAKTDYLVVGGQEIERVGTDGMSSKEEKAYRLNSSGKAHIQIISEAKFISLLNNASEFNTKKEDEEYGYSCT